MGEFYKMEYDAWDEGTVDLSLEEEAAYLRLCHQIYRRKGPVLNSAKLLCSIWRCHANRARRLLTALLQSGKISFTEDHKLTNERASVEIANRVSRGQSYPVLPLPQTPTKLAVTHPQTPTKLEFAPQKPLKSLGSKIQRREEKRREEKIESRARRRPVKTPFPPDMKSVPDEYRDWAHSRDIEPPRVDSIFIRWRAYSIKNGIQSMDWFASWQDQVETVLGWDEKDRAKIAALARSAGSSLAPTNDSW